MSSTSSKLRRWALRATLALGGTLVGLLAVEVIVRLLPPNAAAELLFNAPDNAPSGLYSNDHDSGHIPTPGFEGEIRSLGYKVPLRVNSLGLRGAELGPKTGARWLALGDSFTFAAQVPEQQSFVALLAEKLGVEVLNAGADGYGTQHERARYKQLERVVEPDVVLVVFFVGNDFGDNQRWSGALQRARARPQGQPLAGGFRSPLQKALSRRSALYGMWAMAQREAQMAQGGPEAQRWRGELALFHQEGEAALRALQGQTRPALRSLRDDARARGDRLIVAVAAPAFTVESHRTAATLSLVGLDPSGARVQAPEQAALSMLARERIQSCDLGPDLRAAYADGESMYLDYDGHWTAAGHAVVAKTLAQCAQISAR